MFSKTSIDGRYLLLSTYKVVFKLHKNYSCTIGSKPIIVNYSLVAYVFNEKSAKTVITILVGILWNVKLTTFYNSETNIFFFVYLVAFACMYGDDAYIYFSDQTDLVSAWKEEKLCICYSSCK